jgi:NADP-dependent 3-hydroxy acid dehydrogenase YdfG
MSGVLIVGAGPGLGQAITLRFAREGMPVAVVARRRDTVAAVAAAVEALGVPALALAADAADERALTAAITTAGERFGVPDALIYNAAIIQQDSIGQLSAAGHLSAWAVNVVGALTAAAVVAPGMAQRGSGSIILTGGMPIPDARHASLSLGKAGVRALTTMLHEQYGPVGVHAATVTVGGEIAPGTFYDPDDIAEHYWRLHTQGPDDWHQEIVHSEPAAAPVNPR